MTTTITVETHNWPVSVETHQEHSFSDAQTRSSGWSTSTRFVPKNTKEQFTISANTTLVVREMAEDATGLDYGQQDVPVAAAQLPN